MSAPWTDHPDPCMSCQAYTVVRRELPVPCCDGRRAEIRCVVCRDEWAVESHPQNCPELMWTMPQLEEGEFPHDPPRRRGEPDPARPERPMTQQELKAIEDYWLCPPEEYAAKYYGQRRDPRPDICALIGELRRVNAQLRAERDSHAMTMTYVESDGEEGMRAW